MAHRDDLVAAHERILALQREVEDLRAQAQGEEAGRLRELRAESEALRKELEAARRESEPLRDQNERLVEKMRELEKNLKAVAPPARYEGRMPVLSEWNRSRPRLQLPASSSKPAGVQCLECARFSEASEMIELPMNYPGAVSVVCPRCGCVGLKFK